MYFLGRIILVDEEVKQVLADNLIFLRNIKGLTQEQVAEVIGISRQSYSKWEQGETYPDIDKCDKLAKYYGVTIDSLVHQDNKVDDIKIAPAPIGKHLWGTVTIGSKGQIVIPKAAREAFEHEKQKQEDLGLHCEVTIDGYTDFIFINRFGQAQHQATLNKQSEELSVIAMMSSFCTVMNLMCYFLILAATRLDIHLQQECVKLE